MFGFSDFTDALFNPVKTTKPAKQEASFKLSTQLHTNCHVALRTHKKLFNVSTQLKNVHDFTHKNFYLRYRIIISIRKRLIPLTSNESRLKVLHILL